MWIHIYSIVQIFLNFILFQEHYTLTNVTVTVPVLARRIINPWPDVKQPLKQQETQHIRTMTSKSRCETAKLDT